MRSLRAVRGCAGREGGHSFCPAPSTGKSRFRVCLLTSNKSKGTLSLLYVTTQRRHLGYSHPQKFVPATRGVYSGVHSGLGGGSTRNRLGVLTLFITSSLLFRGKDLIEQFRPFSLIKPYPKDTPQFLEVE